MKAREARIREKAIRVAQIYLDCQGENCHDCLTCCRAELAQARAEIDRLEKENAASRKR